MPCAGAGGHADANSRIRQGASSSVAPELAALSAPRRAGRLSVPLSRQSLQRRCRPRRVLTARSPGHRRRSLRCGDATVHATPS